MEKISAALRKTIKTLATTKGRKAEHAFMAERSKTVLDLLDGPFPLRWLVATFGWYESHPDLNLPAERCLQATTSDMERMTAMKTPAEVLAVFEIPVELQLPTPKEGELYIALDCVQDPGNLGTIVRLADWFGVRHIYADSSTVDIFNPKCVLATMGSLKRVNVHYCDLPDLLTQAKESGINVWGTFMEGENIYSCLDRHAPTGIIVMGNEGSGISKRVEESITARIHIPSYPPGHHGAESLNVAMATAITLAEFRRVATEKAEN